jgi:hypothetical protein
VKPPTSKNWKLFLLPFSPFKSMVIGSNDEISLTADSHVLFHICRKQNIALNGMKVKIPSEQETTKLQYRQ